MAQARGDAGLSTENPELLREALQAFNRRDVEWVVAHTTPDVEWYPAVAAGVEGQPFRGHQGLRQFFAELNEVWEQFSLEAEEMRDLGDHILFLGRVRARARNGVVFEQSLDGIWEIRDGKIARGRSYLDREQALRAAGEIAGNRGAFVSHTDTKSPRAAEGEARQ